MKKAVVGQTVHLFAECDYSYAMSCRSSLAVKWLTLTLSQTTCWVDVSRSLGYFVGTRLLLLFYLTMIDEVEV